MAIASESADQSAAFNTKKLLNPMRDPGFGVVTQISHIWHSRHDYGRTYGQPDRKLTVSRPLQTPLRPEFYKLSSASSAWEETKDAHGPSVDRSQRTAKCLPTNTWSTPENLRAQLKASLLVLYFGCLALVSRLN